MPRPTKKMGFSDRLAEFNHRFWIFEGCACFISWIALLIVVGGFFELNNRPYKNWPSSVLTFLVTVMKAALMIPVVGSIGQLKWHHFRGKNASGLKVLETYSDAARGSTGALKLLKLLKFW
jgi:hypothetical protein